MDIGIFLIRLMMLSHALSAYAKHILNITYAYKLIKVFYVTIHSSEDKI